jgi:hypothetical protein
MSMKTAGVNEYEVTLRIDSWLPPHKCQILIEPVSHIGDLYGVRRLVSTMGENIAEP